MPPPNKAILPAAAKKEPGIAAQAAPGSFSHSYNQSFPNIYSNFSESLISAISSKENVS